MDMYLSRMVSLVLVMAALGSAGVFWTKPHKTDKADRAATITAVQHGWYAAPAHSRGTAR
jgi:hypothetical protein